MQMENQVITSDDKLNFIGSTTDIFVTVISL